MIKLEELTLKDVSKMSAEHMVIKGHDCYFAELGDFWGYTALVFKNGVHIHYADEYQSKWRSVERSELREKFIQVLNESLFTEDELIGELKDYEEYDCKLSYLVNRWVYQFDNLSIYDDNFKRRRHYYPYACGYGRYVKDEGVANRYNELRLHLEKAVVASMKSDRFFKDAVRRAFKNTECYYSGDYEYALEYLGLKFEDLDAKRQEFALAESRRCA